MIYYRVKSLIMRCKIACSDVRLVRVWHGRGGMNAKSVFHVNDVSQYSISRQAAGFAVKPESWPRD